MSYDQSRPPDGWSAKSWIKHCRYMAKVSMAKSRSQWWTGWADRLDAIERNRKKSARPAADVDYSKYAGL